MATKRYCPCCAKEQPTTRTEAANGYIVRCLMCGGVIEAEIGGKHGKE
jgi:uncharacterized Zn finger protein